MERNAMTTPHPAANRPWWKGWSDFWFRPSDPTTLGFMRICTGLLVLYIHLAYSFDLQAFFGQHGWYGLKYVDRERRELPNFVTPFSEWDEQFAFPRLSDFPHRREEFMQFLKQTYLPNPKNPEAKPNPAGDLAYLFRINEMRNPADFVSAMLYVENMTTEEARERYLKVLAGGKVEQPSIGPEPKHTTTSSNQPPAVFVNLPVEEKARLVGEIRAFLNAIDRVQWRDPVWGRNYVLSYLRRDIPPDARGALIRYMKSLTEPDVDIAQRQKLLD
jgi:hypothetical protein